MWVVDTPTDQHADGDDSGTGLYVPGDGDTVIGVHSYTRGNGYFVRTADHYAAIDAAIRSQTTDELADDSESCQYMIGYTNHNVRHLQGPPHHLSLPRYF